MTALQDLIRNEPPLECSGAAVYSLKPILEKKYRFTSRFDEEVLLHRVKGDKILLPRALCPVGPNDKRAIGEPVKFPKCPTPRDNQVEVFAKTKAALLEGRSGLVRAYTGWGKTILGYFCAHAVQRKTLVITTKDDIYKQWIKDAPAMLGISPNEVGEIRGDKCEVHGTSFCVAMIHSLSILDKYPEWITKGFGLVIFDECHRVPADQFQRVADMFPAKLRLGLSATHERSDGKEILVRAHIGSFIAETEGEELIPKVLRFKSSWQCPRTFRHDKFTGQKKVVRIPHEPGKTTHIEKILAADPERNAFLADLIYTAYSRDRKLVVFSTLHDHLKAMFRHCHEHFKIPTKDMGYYIGATTKAEKEAREKVKVKPVIFTTYGMMGEGTNIPWLDAAILAIPRSNVTQPVGRIRREYEGKTGCDGDNPPVVMDVIDEDSPVFNGYANSREHWYAKTGCVVKNMNF